MTRRNNNGSEFNRAFVAGQKSNIISLAKQYINDNMEFTRIEGVSFTHRIEGPDGEYSAIRLVRSRRKTWARLSIVSCDGWHVQEDISQLQLEQLECFIKHHNRILDEKIKAVEKLLPGEISVLEDITIGRYDKLLKRDDTYLEEIYPKLDATYVRNMRHLLSDGGKHDADRFISMVAAAKSYADGYRRGIRHNSVDMTIAVKRA